jgi:hypothetical protein
MVGKNSEVREVVTEARFAEPSNDSLIIQYNVRGQWGSRFIATDVSGEFCGIALILDEFDLLPKIVLSLKIVLWLEIRYSVVVHKL